MLRIRLVPVIFIVILSLAILFGAWRVYQHLNVVGPLQENLQKVEGVQSVEVEAGNPTVIHVQLGPVPDLQTAYTDLVHTVSGTISGPESLLIEDRRSPQLVSAYESLTPTLMEGVASGRYREMIANVADEAKRLGVQAKVTMDEHNIYIQLSSGDHYLYKVLPYTLHQGGGSS
ncbi:hypothetical protein [Alicyclobacillus macrosporangiidus]|jgi:hypothetical protein|uniref:Uncharacterized protein n=1 Tax=Alicyclobacillus macrosporangiidus TaxID=392015 RepID=A0A1I7KV31_9BACL|nr:hypothetical protein [Alicyclobacillus macrosporangiidus]SFV01164.1 hypothetical protein SAMN05421543_11948 [Alicyclobacillus macrosporangiidus]